MRRLEELDRVDREQGLGAMPLGTPEPGSATAPQAHQERPPGRAARCCPGC